jgi:hypothetical protein
MTLNGLQAPRRRRAQRWMTRHIHYSYAANDSRIGKQVFDASEAFDKGMGNVQCRPSNVKRGGFFKNNRIPNEASDIFFSYSE